MLKPATHDLPESDRLAGAPHPRDTHVLFGHAEAEWRLLDAYRSGALPHAWIIGGAEGIGKATLAWRFARFMLAFPDPLSAADAATLAVPPDHPVARRLASLSHGNLSLLRRGWNDRSRQPYTEIRVEDVRGAAQVFRQAASEPGYRICIIDSADDLNRHAANALLKLVEEPPPLSLFLLVGHRPGRLLPTLRSRCRLVMLQPLDAPGLAQALGAMDLTAFAERPDLTPGSAALTELVAEAGGAVRAALLNLDPQSRRRVQSLLARLPVLDWREVHLLADGLVQREAAGAFDRFVATVLDWLAAQVALRAGQGAARLAPFARVWENFGEAAREAETFNLDRRPLVFSLFRDLATAFRGSHP